MTSGQPDLWLVQVTGGTISDFWPRGGWVGEERIEQFTDGPTWRAYYSVRNALIFDNESHALAWIRGGHVRGVEFTPVRFMAL